MKKFSLLVCSLCAVCELSAQVTLEAYRDSVFVNVWQSADTIYKVREVFKYRDRVQIKHDTIKDVQVDVRYKERVDTAFIDKVQVKTEYVKRGFSWWQKALLWLGAVGAAMGGLLAWITLRK